MTFSKDTTSTDDARLLSPAQGSGGGGAGGGYRFSARELAELLHTDPHSPVLYPTTDQARVIEAPLEPLLVLAGAGSGKTKTMADRVVWLVANSLVRPEQILGVTFTRKAAGELATRIRQRLAALYQHLDSDSSQNDVGGPDRIEPTVSTYHSFANGIVQDYGLRLGVERDSTLLGSAQSWQLASEVVEAYQGDWEHLRAAKSTLVKSVLAMAGECAEHLVSPATVRAEIRTHLGAVEELPYLEGSTKASTQAVEKLLDRLRTRISVSELVEAYAAAKLARRQLDFGDLVALAARIAQTVPEACELERQKYSVVLLDEFQDTSHAQMVLFARLFADGRAVTAVGDPHQSIYGFRGASAGQLSTFRTSFPVGCPDGPRSPSLVANLSVAWRNATSILTAANAVAAPLNRPAPWLREVTALAAPQLEARPQAPVGEVWLGRYSVDAVAPTASAQLEEPATGGAASEAEAIAAQIMKHSRRSFETDDAGTRLQPSIAVLCRGRKQFEPIRRELERHGIPVQVVGLGGLLRTPEIVDLVATLRVLGDPDRSDSMLRLLAGARWQIGPADLMALGDWARQLARTRLSVGAAPQSPDAPDPETAPPPVYPDLAEAGSLVEAVDRLPPTGWESATGRRLTATARERLARLRDELRSLRESVGDDLGTLISEVEHRMLLDIEVAAKPGVGLHEARRNLDAFAETVIGFSAAADRVDLQAFLAWLEAANAQEDGLSAPQLEASREAVQLLTVHAAKGLEWDVVVVPGLNEGAFPSGKDSRWSVGDAAIPWTLRGDAPELPHWDWEQEDQKAWLESEISYTGNAKAHSEREERRLAYVAFTRAKHVLIATSFAWSSGKTRPAGPSAYISALHELADAQEAGFGVLQWVSEDDIGTVNPANAQPQRASWPLDPLGARRGAVEEAAAAVDEASRQLTGAGANWRAVLPATGRWVQEVELILERAARDGERIPVGLPAHISASTLVEFAADPAAVLRQLRRPVPREPGRAARKGTAFHAWIEEFYGSSGMLDLGEYAGASNLLVEDELGLEHLVDTFRRSPWAERVPEGIEIPVETRVGGVVVRGRIDAVFRDDDGGWDLIDWKTGRTPDAAGSATRAVQLALYRLAWARLKDVPPSSVRAAFFYVSAGTLVRPHALADESELESIVAGARAVGEL